jgi:uncharacterized repeat protein (TIGR03847 family)
MSRRYLFDLPERFVAGALGEPGSRTFYLQASDAGRIVSVVLEKVQVAVLADRLTALLDELDRRGITKPVDEELPIDADPLDEPVSEAFRAGTLTLGWDVETERVLVEARAVTDDEEEVDEDMVLDDEDAPDLLSVRLSPLAARSFVDRAVQVIGAGRPPCPICGQPLDPHGHICPRRNGHYVN